MSFTAQSRNITQISFLLGDIEFDPAAPQYKEFYKGKLSQLILFVRDVVTTKQLPFEKSTLNGTKAWAPSSLALSNFHEIPSYIYVAKKLPSQYEFCEHITVFVEVCNELGMDKAPSNWSEQHNLTVNTLTDYNQLSTAEIFNLIFQHIRDKWRNGGFNTRWHKRRNQVLKLFNEYSQYILSLFAQNARLLVIRVDLSYGKEVSGFKTVDIAINDFNHFLTNTRFNSIFDEMKGYIAKLEYGLVKGIHWHTIFFFNGAIRRPASHVNLAYEIGNYWSRTITKGEGIFWNCNEEHSNFEKRGIRGIGDIKADDKQLINNLINFVLRYVCKTEQYVRPKFESKKKGTIRHFRRGNFPNIAKRKLGRPRKSAAQLP